MPLVGLWHDVRMSTEPVIDSRPVWARLHRRSLLGAVVCAALAVLLVTAVVTAFHEPDTGTDSRGMTISYGLITIVFLTAAAIAFATAAVARRAPSRPPAPAPGWYADPSSIATWRFWDGHGWTDRVA